MEKQSFSYRHPYLGGILAIIVYFIIMNLVGTILGFVLHLFGGKTLTDEMAMEIGIIIAAILCLIIHRFRHRKEKYKGALIFRRSAAKDIWKCVLIVGLIDILMNIPSWLTLEGGIRSVVLPTAASLCTSVFAGVNEEIIFRAIPVSIMMRKKPGVVRIYGSVIITAIIFAALHISNLFAGATGAFIILQLITAFILGTFFAAVYIRSGSILVPIIFHTLHDLLAFMDPRQASGVGTMDSISMMDIWILLLSGIPFIIGAFYLLRRSVWKEEKQIWAKIWNEKENEEEIATQSDEKNEEQIATQNDEMNEDQNVE